MVLQLQNISKKFGTLSVIDNLNASIKMGEIVSLVGPSGCGKSTLLRMVAGVETPEAGRIVRSIPLERTSFVFQDVRLLPWSSALQNVLFVLQDRIDDSDEREQHARNALERVGLADFSDYTPPQLSGGMQKRVAIARALAIEPDLILFDEPFSDLDLPLRMLLIQDIHQLLKAGNKTAIYVTHDIREALILSDRIFVLSARPAQVRDVISLPEMSSSTGTLSPELQAIETKVMTILKSETQQQNAITPST